eukprot:CAMPEP_0185857418 /NCGR_PEP_ID=MMETSP1354-20130828/29497_1 /TAXON_ID=708628 /ORGANISM="Erythrolobus madagascarensis, Strain CCMP3276" /LENGTH=201 /DNA_ID=CAMNT_0028559689 /DNA_START=38 /DNA_END=641 /DNA_ORIENTATION=-
MWECVRVGGARGVEFKLVWKSECDLQTDDGSATGICIRTGVAAMLGATCGRETSGEKKENIASARNNRDPHYLANMGKVLDTLRHDYPRMLTEAPQMDIYTKDVIFRERLTADLHGKDAYLAFFWGLRFHCWVLLRNAQMEIKSLFVDEDRSAIHIRWRLSGYLRLVNVNWVLDGLSIYRLNSEGLCYLHTLENTVPPQAW